MPEIIHVDLDGFFVAVERQLDPRLAARPIVIGGQPSTHGVVVAACAEAARRGVRPGLSLAIAAARCPDAAFLDGAVERYLEASAAVDEILRDPHTAGAGSGAPGPSSGRRSIRCSSRSGRRPRLSGHRAAWDPGPAAATVCASPNASANVCSASSASRSRAASPPRGPRRRSPRASRVRAACSMRCRATKRGCSRRSTSACCPTCRPAPGSVW